MALALIQNTPAADKATTASVRTIDVPAHIIEARADHNAGLRAILPEEVINQELSASSFAWVGYAFMTPMERTARFMADYETAFRKKYATRCNIKTDVGAHEYPTVWAMRQSADETRLPYPLYLDICFSLYRTTSPDKFSRPHLRFAGRQISRTWRRRRDEMVGQRLWSYNQRLARVPQFSMPNYAALPSQKALRSLVIGRFENGRRLSVASVFAIQHPVLRPSELLSRVSDVDDRHQMASVLASDLKDGRVVREQTEVLADHDLIQGCFGWRRESEICRTCPHALQCAAVLELLD
jgi:hypothetical protein